MLALKRTPKRSPRTSVSNEQYGESSSQVPSMGWKTDLKRAAPSGSVRIPAMTSSFSRASGSSPDCRTASAPESIQWNSKLSRSSPASTSSASVRNS